jgi:hypothetical protein
VKRDRPRPRYIAAVDDTVYEIAYGFFRDLFRLRLQLNNSKNSSSPRQVHPGKSAKAWLPRRVSVCLSSSTILLT